MRQPACARSTALSAPFPQAERCRMLVGPADLLPPAPDPDDADAQPAPALAEAVAALEVAGSFMFDAATHRDFLGAVLGTGIERSKVGPWRQTARMTPCADVTVACLCLSFAMQLLIRLDRAQAHLARTRNTNFLAVAVPTWLKAAGLALTVQVGDILVMGDRGAQLLVDPQLADFVCEALTSVRPVP
jgi:RNA-binding protein YlmH